MSIEVVAGKEATIHFDAQKCIHSRSCVLSHPDVFVPNVVGAWIHPDAQPVEELVRIAQNCPSGAITVVRHSAGTTGFADSNGHPIVNTVLFHKADSSVRHDPIGSIMPLKTQTPLKLFF